MMLQPITAESLYYVADDDSVHVYPCMHA